MAKENPDTVLLGTNDEDQHDEAEADGTVTPGELVEVTGTATGGAKDRDTVQRCSVHAGRVPVRVALEPQLGGTGMGLDEEYSDGDHFSYRDMQSGDEFYGFVFDGANAGGAGADVGANANVTKGDRLVAYAGSGQAGTFRALDTGNGDTEGAVLVEAREDVDNSGGNSPARIKLEVV